MLPQLPCRRHLTLYKPGPQLEWNGMQVYHMPGSSDNFVTAFRTWLSKYGGGGPFGPMDSTWLQVQHATHLLTATRQQHSLPPCHAMTDLHWVTPAGSARPIQQTALIQEQGVCHLDNSHGHQLSSEVP